MRFQAPKTIGRLGNNVADVDAVVDDIAPDVGVIDVGVKVAADDGGSAVLVEEVGLVDVAKLDLAALLVLVAADELLVRVADLVGLLDLHGTESSAGDDGSLAGLGVSGSHSGEDDSGDHGIHVEGWFGRRSR
jgi:hypothetical protein